MLPSRPAYERKRTELRGMLWFAQYRLLEAIFALEFQ